MKNILLFYKKSTYKHSFLDQLLNPDSDLTTGFARGKMLKRFKETHANHYRTLARVEAALKERGVKYTAKTRGRWIDFSQYDLIITLGGDGTFLEAARDIKRQFILGINSDPQWSVGRFCNATGETFPKILDRVLKGKYKTRLLSRMRLRINGESAPVNALNDVLICHKNPAAMSRYFLTVNGVKEEHRSSGVWVATAVGSTGAIRSAGGKMLPGASQRLQYKVRELYRGRGTQHRLESGIFSPPIKFTSLMKDGVIYVDGAHACFPFHFGRKVTISNSPESLRVLY